LNIGCGSRFHPSWVNVDIAPQEASILRHDIRRPLPFDEMSFDAVYHSHVLEHLAPQEAQGLLRECRRVLRPGGILRVAVPDLERIAELYLLAVKRASDGDRLWQANHTWMVLEMYDQVVRHASGGEMGRYLLAPTLENEEFVMGRLGAEARLIRCHAGTRSEIHSAGKNRCVRRSAAAKMGDLWRAIRSARGWSRETLLRWLLGEEYQQLQTARFRNGGEIHKWMYDRYSLGQLLHSIGLADVRKVEAWESQIPNWSQFSLDVESDGTVRKPDSLFMEAVLK
jgi:predicted SAM-dependent methyltransferase